jgi:hypothetical protein
MWFAEPSLGNRNQANHACPEYAADQRGPARIIGRGDAMIVAAARP